MRGRDIKRYGFDFADLYIIATFPSRNYDIDDYPAIKEYLLSFGMERMEQTGKEYVINGETIKARKKTNNKWYETQDSISYWDDFSKQKIVWGEISDKPKFTFDKEGKYFLSNKAFLLTGNNLYQLLAFLNSQLCQYYFSQIATTTGEGTVQWLKYKIETVPIPPFDNEYGEKLYNLVSELLEGVYTNNIDEEINNTIYSIYKFNDIEINYITKWVNQKNN